MPTKTIARGYATLSGEVRFRLAIEAMARGDRTEEKRLGDSCPLMVYRCEDEAYRGRMRRLYTIAVTTALEIRERMVVLRAAAAFGTHGRDLIDASFAPLLQAAFLASRDVGQWEAGAAAEDRSGTVVLSAEIRQDLADVAACTSEATDCIAAAMKDAAAALHASAVLTRWAVFGGFCRGALGLEPMAVMRAWGLMEWDLTLQR